MNSNWKYNEMDTGFGIMSELTADLKFSEGDLREFKNILENANSDWGKEMLKEIEFNFNKHYNHGDKKE